MLILPGYQIEKTVEETARSFVYRGCREADGQAVILKSLKDEYPSPESIARFKREYEIARTLQADTSSTYNLEFHDNKMIIIMEDDGGVSLSAYHRTHKLSLLECLDLAIKAADGLEYIHRHNVIHKDFNPSNIIYNPDNGLLKIIDFGIATVLSRETPTFRNPNVLEGTLAYMSPEQTGRMNRAMDYRTDYYSLGVTLYELLSGQLPFDTSDAMALVHAHIARRPPSLHEINADIPTAVSDIVMKLMAKNARDRYQSTHGLKADLEQCRQQLQSSGKIEPFPLGQEDFSERFHIPQKLYGRDAEINTLLAALDRASQGDGEMMLVSGYAGVGKTALVQETYKPLTGRRGYFISGKFDQLQRHTPYSSLIQAFRALIQQILTESEADITGWQAKLLDAFGPNGQIIIDVIPEVELIVRPQPAAAVLAPAEAQNRFNLLFQNFIKVFTQPEHPLVIFLDDLQWADAASLKLIQLLMTGADHRYLFLIGAYRNNEVNATHPLMLTLDEIKQTGATVNRISLQPLDLPVIAQFTADALRSTPEKTHSLAELLLTKTNGNPFFMNEFLKSLYTEGLLTFDYQQRGWQWNLVDIQAKGLADNVVELMAGKIQQLSEVTQQALKMAACIGSRFDLQTLSIVTQKTQRATAVDLWPAVVEGLIAPVDDAYKWVDVEWENQSLGQNIQVAYHFAHDRIQQAVYTLIATAEKQAVHLKVGRLLLENSSSDRHEQKLFDIVNHLNLGRDLIDEQIDRDELAALNLLAGQKAKASAAYESALSYLKTGVNCLQATAWEKQYDLALGLHVASAEAAYLSTDFDEMARLAAVVRRQARTPLDQVKIYETEIQAGIAQNKLLEALQIALQVLRLLGETFPEQPSQRDFDQGLEEIKATLADRQVADLIDLPIMTDPAKRAAMRVMSRVFSAAYLTAPEMFSLIIFRQVQLSIKHGNASESAFAYAGYGLILCGAVEDLDAGYQFGKLALSLLDKFNDKERRPRVLELVHAFITHWKEHVKNTLQPLLEAYQVALETGDLGYASFSAFVRVYHLYAASYELEGVEREMAQYSSAIAALKQETVLHLNDLYWQVVLNLLGNSQDPCHLLGEAYNEEKMVPLHVEANDMGALYHFYFNKLVLCYLFHEYAKAVQHAEMAEKYLDSVTASLPVPLFFFYDSLSRLALYPESEPSEQEVTLKKVAANQEKMSRWAAHAPMNYQHKFYLVEAEQARVLEQHGTAREYYDQAIALARENEYVNEEALAQELAAQYYLARGQLPVAQVYLREARYAYIRWRALAKVEHLEAQFPNHFFQASKPPPNTTLMSLTPTTTGHRIASALDFTSVIKASQAISSEIELDKLLATLLKIVIENAGAQRGYLLLVEQGQTLIAAAGAVDQEQVQVFPSLPLERVNKGLDGDRDEGEGEVLPRLSPEIVQYVARTKESVVLNDARQEGRFVHTAYITEQQPKSILCSPLLKQGELLGIIYLENNLTTAVFTSERMELVSLLGTQAAISITNAQIIAARAEQERLQLENEFLERQSEDLARLNADKDKFFSIVSHDLRGPFSALLTGSQVMLARLDQLTTDEVRERTQYIHNSSRAAYTLLENLLTWSRLQMGRMTYRPEHIKLDRLAQNTVNLLQEVAANKNIQLSHTIPDSTLTFVDRYMIETVIRNLTSNAIKFTPIGGQVTISAEAGPIVQNEESEAMEEFITVSVTDTGVGMSPENLSKLFRIDVHFTSRGTEDESGTGLGLTICKEMVDKNQGQIWVESELGQGTTVKFTIPVGKELE